ncbi:MAG: hypothetical protein HY057_11265 [Rhodospirillales bacterium]|nr:hypothetical protein [Rhodospirillales bacterium]
MHRIDTTTKAPDLFGSGKHGFRDGNPSSGTPATGLDANFFNAIQEELARAVEASGVPLDVNNHGQVLQALRLLIGTYDIPFIAGFGADGAGEDIQNRLWGSVVLARNITLEGEAGYLGVVATGQPLIVDIRKNGTTVYSALPQFAAGASAATPGQINPAAADCSAGDRLDFHVMQVGSTAAGRLLRLTAKARLR